MKIFKSLLIYIPWRFLLFSSIKKDENENHLGHIVCVTKPNEETTNDKEIDPATQILSSVTKNALGNTHQELTAITFTNVVFPEYCKPTNVSSISSFQKRLLNQSNILLIIANILVFVFHFHSAQNP